MGNETSQPADAKAAAGGGATKTKRVSHLASILGQHFQDLKELYTVKKELRRDNRSVTYRCVSKATGELFAVKVIAKRSLVTEEDVEDVKRELEIFDKMKGHPNVVQLHQVLEDRFNLCIVMELCQGGMLFERVWKRFSEKSASNIVRTMLQVVRDLHAKSILHRNISPDHFAFLNKSDDAPLKLTDFSHAVYCQPGQTQSEMVGTIFYLAPEVFMRSYSLEADEWSIGVVLYILLCGAPPFFGETEEDIEKKVKLAKPNMTARPWPKISAEARDLVKKLLYPDARMRLTAADALNHVWIEVEGTASDAELDGAVLEKFKQFSNMNKMQKLALKVMAGHLMEQEVRALQEMFLQLDVDNSGTLTYQELKEGFKKMNSKLGENELMEMVKSVDMDNNGTIDYHEFVTATMQLNKTSMEQHLHEAFRHFDADGSGHISREELKEALCNEDVLEPEELDEILDEVDADKDGDISFSEFVSMMMKGMKSSGQVEKKTVKPSRRRR